MTKKIDTSEVFIVVANGLAMFWKNYKRTCTSRQLAKASSIFGMITTSAVDDVTAAKYLASDIREIRKAMVVKKTDRAFEKLVKDSLN